MARKRKKQKMSAKEKRFVIGITMAVVIGLISISIISNSPIGFGGGPFPYPTGDAQPADEGPPGQSLQFCEDTDNQWDWLPTDWDWLPTIYRIGKVIYTVGGYSSYFDDYCMDPYLLAEYTCTSSVGMPKKLEIDCSDYDTNCIAGACVIKDICVDTDGGKNYFLKGMAFIDTESWKQHVDKCLSTEGHFITVEEGTTEQIIVGGLLHEIKNILVESITTANIEVDEDTKLVTKHNLYTFNGHLGAIQVYITEVIYDPTGESLVGIFIDEKMKRFPLLETGSYYNSFDGIEHEILIDFGWDITWPDGDIIPIAIVTIDGAEMAIKEEGFMYTVFGTKGKIDVYAEYLEINLDELHKSKITLVLGTSKHDILHEKYCEDNVIKYESIKCSQEGSAYCFNGACV